MFIKQNNKWRLKMETILERSMVLLQKIVPNIAMFPIDGVVTLSVNAEDIIDAKNLIKQYQRKFEIMNQNYQKHRKTEIDVFNIIKKMDGE